MFGVLRSDWQYSCTNTQSVPQKEVSHYHREHRASTCNCILGLLQVLC